MYLCVSMCVPFPESPAPLSSVEGRLELAWPARCLLWLGRGSWELSP